MNEDGTRGVYGEEAVGMYDVFIFTFNHPLPKQHRTMTEPTKNRYELIVWKRGGEDGERRIGGPSRANPSTRMRPFASTRGTKHRRQAFAPLDHRGL